MRTQKLKEVKKADGSIVFVGQVYLGIDSVTKKRRNTTVRAKSRRQWNTKAQQAKNEFNENGRTTYVDSFKFETFEELVVNWQRVYLPTLKDSTRVATENYINNYLLPSLQIYQLKDITPRLISSIVKRWAVNADTAIITNGRREKGKGKDYSNALFILKKIFDYAFEVGALESNPAMSIRAPKPQKRTNKQKIKVFTDEELKVWLEYLDTLPDTPKNIYDVNLYMLLLETGMRIGEALALTWKDVDFNNQFIHVEATVTRTKRVQQMPKSQDSVRDIYINANTVKRLKDWKLHQAKTLKTISIGSNGYLFPGAHAPHGNYPQARDQFMRHLKKAGLPNIGLHGFRHTHATLLLNNGADYKEIQHRLGHASISTTMDTYSHLSQEKARQTAEILNFSLKKIQ